MLMTLNRNHTLRSTLGHIIAFKKNEPTGVPDELVGQAREIGAEPASEKDMKKFADMRDREIAETVDAPELSAADRKATIQKAYAKIVKRNRSSEFTAGGAVHANALSQEVGFKVEIRERDEAAAEHQAQQDEKKGE